ncbi:MAG: hypothetical protein K0R54_5536 [Clostridiaceae bacterium]|jgi:hypothetical protein|nr:hypothetical protein [Clostridiaceae bacterium]
METKIMKLNATEVLRNNIDQGILNLGVNTYKAVFPNSLLLNKLTKLGLKIKNEKTDDIIALEFEYGFIKNEDKAKVKEWKKQRSQLKAKLKKATDEKELERINAELDKVIENIKISEMTVDQVRDKLYKDGFHLDFYKKQRGIKDENGKPIWIIDKTINYKFWFRTPSKSRVGDVVFINSKLLDNIRAWQRMGLNLPEKNAKVIEMSAYMSLTSSHIESSVIIDPSRILVVNDLDSFYTTNCALVQTNAKGECKVKHERYTLKNTLFDGQALLADELFPDNINFMLLRQHFFKACAFRTRISDFMKDWCVANGKDYNTYTVPDRYGNDIPVKDILMITTENAMKWEKFTDIGASFTYWKQKVNEDDNIFGICKTNHSSKYDNYQRMSYQMINTLDCTYEELEDLAQYTIDKINAVKDDHNKYMEYLAKTSSECNANEMIINLCANIPNFINSDFYKDWKKDEHFEHKKQIKSGKLLTEGDNLTIVGNPYTMLLHAIGEVTDDNIVPEKFVDATLPVNDNYISVYTERFEDKEELALFRNPHNSPNNICYAVNHYSQLMEKYFDFGKNVIAVNMVHTEFQDLANGSDQDSDFVLCTNSPTPVSSAKKVFRSKDFPTIVNQIPHMDSNKFTNTIESYSKIDNMLAKAKKCNWRNK